MSHSENNHINYVNSTMNELYDPIDKLQEFATELYEALIDHDYEEVVKLTNKMGYRVGVLREHLNDIQKSRK